MCETTCRINSVDVGVKRKSIVEDERYASSSS